MRRGSIVVHGGDRFRVGPWRGAGPVASVTPFAGQSPGPEAVERCARVLADRGYVRMVTAALTPVEQRGFLLAGFRVSQRLHLLQRPLDEIAVLSDPSRSAPGRGSLDHRVRRATETGLALRRGTRADRASILELDARCFDAFWTFDKHGLQEALGATPTRRMRVAVDGGIVGYAIFGKAEERGYLQRLAVDPDRRGEGVATALIDDGLRWLRRRGAANVLVNTQEDNETALRLYETLGFRRCPEPLAVLERATVPPS